MWSTVTGANCLIKYHVSALAGCGKFCVKSSGVGSECCLISFIGAVVVAKCFF